MARVDLFKSVRLAIELFNQVSDSVITSRLKLILVHTICVKIPKVNIIVNKEP